MDDKLKETKEANWGSNNTNFNGDITSQKKEETTEKLESDINAIKHSPRIVHEHEIIFDTPWLKVKRAGGYIYSERKGTDSVAFILIAINAADERRIGLINEYKDPLGDFLTTAFGGSIDNEKYHTDLRILVKDETIEEAGFDVSINDIEYHGKAMVSTQSNQFCHLFSVEVNKLNQKERTTTNLTELKSSVSWLSMTDITKLEDWKSQTIILRRMMARNGLIYISPAKK